MARGEVSAARTISSDVPRLRVLVASLAPFLNVSKSSLSRMHIIYLLELSVVGGLLNSIQNLLRQSLVCDWPGSGWIFSHYYDMFETVGWKTW